MKYILIALLFCACNISNRDASLKLSNEPLDTIRAAKATVASTPPLFETAFIKGTTEKLKNTTVNLYGITIGKLKIVSGRIIACDPLHIEEYGIPYTQIFPVGEFPVQLSIARFEDNREMITFARINFSDEPVAKWDLALIEGQAPLPVGGEEIHGYGVDAGIGIFMDHQATKSLDHDSLTNMDAPLYTEMDKHYHDKWKYAMYNFNGHNMAAFTTGIGDGRYATYVGFDANGKPCRLLTDFDIFNWKETK